MKLKVYTLARRGFTNREIHADVLVTDNIDVPDIVLKKWRSTNADTVAEWERLISAGHGEGCKQHYATDHRDGTVVQVLNRMTSVVPSRPLRLQLVGTQLHRVAVETPTFKETPPATLAIKEPGYCEVFVLQHA